MKNKFNLYILIMMFFIVLSNPSFSNEAFNFNVTEIEIKENGNRFIGKNGGVAKTNGSNYVNFYNCLFHENVAKGVGGIYGSWNN